MSKQKCTSKVFCKLKYLYGEFEVDNLKSNQPASPVHDETLARRLFETVGQTEITAIKAKSDSNRSVPKVFNETDGERGRILFTKGYG